MSLHKKKTIDNKLLIGRDEWCEFPNLGLPAVKAKVDTGARTSALHAINIKPFNSNGKYFVSFDIHPLQANSQLTVSCEAEIIDRRNVMSSNGHKEKRYVISTPIVIGSQCWDIQLTLSNRDPLRYRLLIGREALDNRVLIDTGLSCHQGKINKQTLKNLYQLV